MIRRLFVAVLFVAAGTLIFSGCAKKKTASGAAATGSESSITDGMSESGTEGSSTDDMSGSSLSMPVVHFDFNEFTIRSSDRDMLKAASEGLKKSKSTKVTIEGHCDERGSNEYNLALGERRAQSVKSYLQKVGVDNNRLSTISYGEERPADSSTSDSAWSKNRRAEIVINR